MTYRLEDLHELNINRQDVINKHKFITGKGDWTGGKKCKVLDPVILPGYSESSIARDILKNCEFDTRKDCVRIEIPFGECPEILAGTSESSRERRD